MAHSVSERLQQFLGAPSPATDDRALRAECGQFVRNLRLSRLEQGLLLVQVMQAYTGHCGWTGQGAKMWQLMEYLVRRSGLQFERQAMLDCLALLPRFAECCFPSQTLAATIATNIARLGYWPALTPALEGICEMKRRSSRSQGAGRIAGLLLWNDPYTRITPEQCATAIIRQELPALSPEWRALFLSLPPWKNEPSASWLRTARAHLALVGPEGFASRFCGWSVSLAENSPVRISPAGAEVLKSLLWRLGLLPSSSGDGALNAFRRVEYQRSCRKLAEKVDLAVARLVNL